jgi:hypothetical protein
MTTASEIREACLRRDRATIQRLVEAIPQSGWDVSPGLAVACLSPVTVRVWHAEGGSGINTYTKVHVSVDLDDLDGPVPSLFVDNFTDDELKIPNYIPRDARPILVRAS